MGTGKSSDLGVVLYGWVGEYAGDMGY